MNDLYKNFNLPVHNVSTLIYVNIVRCYILTEPQQHTLGNGDNSFGK